MRRSISSIRTGSTASRLGPTTRGEVDAWLVLASLAFLQIFVWNSLRLMAESWAESLGALGEEDRSEPTETLQVFGESWPAPRPRIDYGAYHQKNRDAEALCIVGSSSLPRTDYESLDCE